MNGMFYNAASFAQNLDNWNVTSANTDNMFVNSGYQYNGIRLPSWYIKLHPDENVESNISGGKKSKKTRSNVKTHKKTRKTYRD